MEFFPVLLIVGVIGLAILFRVVAGGMDQQRIREYVEGRGGRLLSCQWSPFGTGWWGEKSDRIYEVRFRDRDGNLHQATAKTSMWTGVYWTEDRISQYAAGHPAQVAPEEDRQYVSSLEDENRRLMALEEENRRLREEVERLKHRQF
jgi:hypothetical protein